MPGAKALGVDKLAGKVGGNLVVQAAKANAALLAFILIAIAGVGGGGFAIAVSAMGGGSYEAAPDPTTLSVEDWPAAVKPVALVDDENATNPGAEVEVDEEPNASHLMPGGWANVLYEGQEDALGKSESGIVASWPLLAGLARAQTDFGRKSPYDTIDRTPDRHEMFGTAATDDSGSSGLGAAQTTTPYEGPIRFIGHNAQTLASLMASAGLKNQFSATETSLDGLAGALPAESEGIGAVYVSLPPTANPAKVQPALKALYKAAGDSTSVYVLDVAVPQAPEKADRVAEINEALAASISAHEGDNKPKKVNWAAVADVRPDWFKNDGSLKPAGQAGMRKNLKESVKSVTIVGRWMVPIRDAYRATGTFGYYGSRRSSSHTGADMAIGQGTKVYAANSGVVTRQDWCEPESSCVSYGRSLRILHAGDVTTLYAHMIKHYVKEGDRVSAGQLIGEVGSTGNSTGPHLHFETRLNGGSTPVDPSGYVKELRSGPVASTPDDEHAHEHAHDRFPGLSDRELGKQAGKYGSHQQPVTPAGQERPTLSPNQYLADNDSCDVELSTPIGEKGKKQGRGVFLLTDAAIAELESEDLNPASVCDQAQYVSMRLGKTATELSEDNDWFDWDSDPEVAKKFWAQVVTDSEIFVDPNKTTASDCAEMPAGLTVTNKIEVAFKCYGEGSSISLVQNATLKKDGTVKFETLEGADAIDTLVTEALTVANTYSKLGTAACKPDAETTGVFPLTKAEAEALAIIDRCDEDETIAAVAKAVTEAESAKIDTRPTTKGKYEPMLGGWGLFSNIVGSQAALFSQVGPTQPFNETAQCTTAVSEAVTSVQSSMTANLDKEERKPADDQKIRNRLFTTAVKNACVGATNVDLGGIAALTAESLLPKSTVVQDDDGVVTQTYESSVDDLQAGTDPNVIAARLQVLAKAASEAEDDDAAVAVAPQIGTHSLVHRLAKQPVKLKSANSDMTSGLNTQFPTGKYATAYANQYAGLVEMWKDSTYKVIEAASVVGEAGTSAVSGTSGAVDASKLIAAAKAKLGLPYKWGATGPNSYDCSGFTQYAYGSVGITLPRVSGDQAQQGKAVADIEHALPGDLVAFAHGGRVTHVGIYLGNGQMIHAPRTGKNIEIAPLSYGGAPLSHIRRLLPEQAASTFSYQGARTKDGKKLAVKLPEGGKPFAELFVAAGKQHGLDPALIAAVAYQESTFIEENIYCKKESEAGAKGIMQFMKPTADEVGVDPCDPAQAIGGGAKYLAQQIRTFGNLELGLAAYNAGPGYVRRYKGVPPFTETRDYVIEVPQKCIKFGGCRGNKA